MSWSTAQQTRFAAQGARLRQSTQSGPTAPNGYNLSYTDTAGTTHQLRLAFARYEQTRDLEEGGYRYQVDAVAMLPDAHGLTLALGNTLTYLPLTETYRVDGIASHPGTVEKKIILRRVNGQAAE